MIRNLSQERRREEPFSIEALLSFVDHDLYQITRLSELDEITDNGKVFVVIENVLAQLVQSQYTDPIAYLLREDVELAVGRLSYKDQEQIAKRPPVWYEERLQQEKELGLSTESFVSVPYVIMQHEQRENFQETFMTGLGTHRFTPRPPQRKKPSPLKLAVVKF